MVVAWTCRSVTFHGFTDCRELVYCLPDVVVLNPGEAVGATGDSEQVKTSIAARW